MIWGLHSKIRAATVLECGTTSWSSDGEKYSQRRKMDGHMQNNLPCNIMPDLEALGEEGNLGNKSKRDVALLTFTPLTGQPSEYFATL